MSIGARSRRLGVAGARLRAMLVAAVLSLGCASFPREGIAQDSRAEEAGPARIVTVDRGGYTVSGLVAVRDGVTAPKYGIALFPGHPGILRLREEAGVPRFDLAGNFLVRSRRHWLDDETLVVVIDAPSDQWATFLQSFRETPRYGADVAALLAEVSRRHGGIADWTFVGTSEGSLGAWHASRMNPQLATRTILTASVMSASRNGPGLSRVEWRPTARLLWVHHENDPCRFTQYDDARRAAAATQAPLVTVRGGGPARGGVCQAFTEHGFVGVERETVRAMHGWVKRGEAAAVVQP